MKKVFYLFFLCAMALAASQAFCDYSAGELKRDLDRGHYPNIMPAYEANLAALKQDPQSKKLNDFYNEMLADETGLKGWVYAQPNNPVPWTASGLKFLYQSEGDRGMGFTDRMTKDQTDLYVGKAAQASVFFKKAIALNPADPYAYEGLIRAAAFTRLPEEEVKGYFDQALQLVPGFDGAIWNMGLYYSPMNGGTAEKMMQFIRRYGVTAPQGSFVRLLVVRYYEDLGFTQHTNGGIYYYSQPEWKFIKPEFEGYLKAHPDNRGVLCWYSYCAFCGKHYEEANWAFDMLGDQQTTDPYWTDVDYVRAKTAAKYRYEETRGNNIYAPDLPAQK